ncbi:hypothetical protein D9758_011978 [Tetrapyrgos nigripes]|uniref:AAA+ ATPase domain-containing protein n=1 Tax=Tetrapyrgos nigripes TaxID=182062 RepID=A0A8H5D256_9AGAR|nr:hypothetical protein D9758_011978 [Tetrapyrgos nigripes]
MYAHLEGKQVSGDLAQASKFTSTFNGAHEFTMYASDKKEVGLATSDSDVGGYGCAEAADLGRLQILKELMIRCERERKDVDPVKDFVELGMSVLCLLRPMQNEVESETSLQLNFKSSQNGLDPVIGKIVVIIQQFGNTFQDILQVETQEGKVAGQREVQRVEMFEKVINSFTSELRKLKEVLTQTQTDKSLGDTHKLLQVLCQGLKALNPSNKSKRDISKSKEKLQGHLLELKLTQLSIMYNTESFERTPCNGILGDQNNKLVQMPAAPSVFVGRETVIQSITQFLVESQNKYKHLIIQGSPGIGKTSVTLHLINSTDSQFEEKYGMRRYYVACDQFVDLSSTVNSESQNTRGGNNFNAFPGIFVNQEVPMDIEAYHFLVQLFLSLGIESQAASGGLEVIEKTLAHRDQPLLLVLDDVDKLYQKSSFLEDDGKTITVAKIMQRLSAIENVYLLLTMDKMENQSGAEPWNEFGHIIELLPLPFSAAKTAFSLHASQELVIEKGSDWEWIVNQLEGNPLAIMLMARQTSIVSLEYLLEMWTHKPEEDIVAFCLNLSFELCASVNKKVYTLINILSYFPKGISAWPRALNEMWGRGIENLDQAVIVLLNAGIISSQNQTLNLQHSIYLYMHLKYPMQKNDFEQVEKYYTWVFRGLQLSVETLGAQEFLEPHILNMYQIFSHQMVHFPNKNAHIGAVRNVIIFRKFIVLTFPLIDMLFQHEQLSWVDKVDFRLRKAWIFYWMQTYDKAEQEILCAQSIISSHNGNFIERTFDRIANHHVRIGKEADCLRALSDLYIHDNRLSDAVRLLNIAKGKYMGIRAKDGAAVCFWHLGDIHKLVYQYDQALESLLKARQIFLSVKEERFAAYCLSSSADILKRQGNLYQAVEFWNEAREHFLRIGDLQGAAESSEGLGKIHILEMNYNDAIDKLAVAANEFMSIGHQKDAAQCLMEAGSVFEMQENYQKACEQFLQAERLFLSLGDHQAAKFCSEKASDERK